MNEFNLIHKYFADASFVRKDVIIGIGDDAAITQVPANQNLATTTDTLVQGVHFLPNTSAQDIAHKAIAVNLSDLAAMGAEPSWISLSLTLPNANDTWLSAFSNKIAELTRYFSVQLIGGDTVKGPLSLTITAQGFVPEDSVLTRDGAKNGDWIFVTGTLGDAGAGLDILKKKLLVDNVKARDYLVKRHLNPTPRVLAGTILRRLASACIDVSDGLLQDIMHVAKASGTGVILHLEKLPLSEELGNNVSDLHQALDYATVSGDDYELLFTVSEELRSSVQTALNSYAIPHTCIGQMTGAAEKLDLRLNDEPFQLDTATPLGFLTFKYAMDKTLKAKVNLTKPSHFLGFGFGTGLIPLMPGTMGSLAAIPLILLMSYLPLYAYIVVTVVAAVLGISICQKVSDDLGVHDHGSIVWDEVAGMMIVFIAIPISWHSLLIGFVLFRFF